MSHPCSKLALIAILLLSVLLFAPSAQADAPTYYVTLGGGSFSPSPLCIDTTQPAPGTTSATASVTGTLNVSNPNQEYEESGDSWSYSGSISGYSSTNNGSYGSVPPNAPVVGADSSGNVTANADQTTTPGYYQVSVSATDNFNVTHDGTTTPQSQFASTTLTLVVAKADITPHTGSFMVGQGVNASASVSPSDLLPSPVPSGTFQWNIGGTKVADYQVYGNNGVVIPLSNLNGLASQSLHFYWVDDGSHQLSCTISVLSCNPSVTLNVVKPENVSASGTLGAVSVGQNDILDSKVYLHDGVPDAKQFSRLPGLNVPQIALPPSTDLYHGLYQWVQIVTSISANVNNKNNENWVMQTPVVPALDTQFPYSFVQYDDGSIGTQDSPYDPVQPFSGSGEPNDYAVSMQAQDEFDDFLLFEPTTDPQGNPINDAISVPLLEGTWGWSGTLSGGYVDANGSFHGTATGSGHGGHFSPTTTFPQWNSILEGKNIKFTKGR